jgi:hypothetical protein
VSHHLAIEFTYTDQDGEQAGILSYGDGLLGPIVVSPDPESAYTYCAGYSQAGSNAVFLRQEIDAPVEHLVVRRADGPEPLLARFISDWLPARGDLRDQVRLLLSDYLG